MRRLIALALAALALAAPARAEPLFAYAGAGLRPALQPLAERFEAEIGTKVLVEYGGTGQVLARFRTTGRGDVFVAGSAFFTDQLAEEGRIAEVQTLAVHSVAIGVSAAAADRVRGLDDLAQPGLRVALGDPQAMALGRTAEAILSACADAPAVHANTIVRATTLQQLALYVGQGDVDATILTTSAARPQGAAIVTVPVPPRCYTPERITAGVLDSATAPEAARAFLAFLASETGQAGFAAAGFGPAAE